MRYMLSLILILASVPVVLAQSTEQRVQFAMGTSGAELANPLGSGGAVEYLLGAGEGQFMAVDLEPGNPFTNFIIYSPSGEIMAESTQSGYSYYGQLYESGDHTVQVFNNGDTTATHTLFVEIFNSDTGAQRTEDAVAEAAANAPPTEAEQICMRDVSQVSGNGDVIVLQSSFSEAGTEVIVGVEAGEYGRAPWRCIAYSDGTTAGIEFIGEGEGGL